MSITTYAELKTAVANWLARSDLTTYIPDYITLLEAGLNRDLRVREQEYSTDLTVAAQAVSLPTGFMGVRRMYIATDPTHTITYVEPDTFWGSQASVTAGVPLVYTIEAEYFQFGPAPDTSYTVKLMYWKRLDVSSAAHALFTNNPDLYLYGSLLQAAPFINEPDAMPRFQQFADRYRIALESVKLSSVKDRASGTMSKIPDTLGL